MNVNKNLLSLFDLENKVIIITGGAGHLGHKISQGLAEAGAQVIVGSNNFQEFDQRFLDKPDSLKIGFQPLDISDTKSIKDAFQLIKNKYGNIDVLINNAFYSRGDLPEVLNDNDWSLGIDGTLSSVFRCIREVIPFMDKNEGSIINVSSMYGVLSPDFKVYENYKKFFNAPNYGAAKGGVIQLTKYFSVYLAKKKIRVNSVCPGAFPSVEVQKEKDFIKELEKKVPLNRIGKPEDLVGVFVLLASNASEYITGQNIIVDGGWTTW